MDPSDKIAVAAAQLCSRGPFASCLHGASHKCTARSPCGGQLSAVGGVCRQPSAVWF
jgi:hypothetical protein